MAPLEDWARLYVESALAAPPVWEVPLADVRRGFDDETPDVSGPIDELPFVDDRTFEGPAGPIHVRVYRPEGPGPHVGLVYLHGGGWIVGSLESHDPICRAIARRTPCVVVAVDYRRAPEHRYPAALDDAWAALLWVQSQASELGVERFAVGGDSSGGNLAAVVARRARDLGVPLDLQILVYPVTDHDLDSPGYVGYGDGLNLTRAKMKWYWDQYLGGADGAEPDASPLRAADLRGVAPAFVLTAEYDPLCFEGEEYARRLEAAGVSVKLVRYEGQIHGFVRLGALSSDAGRALDEIADVLARPPGS